MMANPNPFMDRLRWTELMKDDSMKLSSFELNNGWHFCLEWDGLLVGPGMGEYHYCQCFGREMGEPEQFNHRALDKVAFDLAAGNGLIVTFQP